MQCTPEQIEKKRREAQLKLAKRNLISNLNSSNFNLSPTTSYNNKHNFNNSGSPTAAKALPNSENDCQNTWRSPKIARNSVFHTNPYEKQNPAASSLKKNEGLITGTCALVSTERFAVDLPYHTQAIEIFKTIPSKSYNPKTRIWDFGINDYDLVQKRLGVLQPDVVVGKLPQYVLNCCKIPKPDYTKIDFTRIDSELMSTLMPFQEDGVCFGIDKNGRCLIADEMGLGKTFQALAIADYYKSNWPLLIVTTTSVKNVWEETIHKYLPSISVMHTQYMVSGKDYIGDSRVLIVSHDMMTRALEKLLQRNFGVIIIDESHNLKNFKAKCTQAAMKLVKRAKRVILLSGTPALSRPSELFSQLSIIDEKFFGNFFDYSKRYCDGKSTHFGWDASGQSNLQELEIVLAKKFMIRRTKEEVLKSLPDKTQEVVALDVNLNQFSDEDRKCLNALAANYNKQKKGTEKHAALLTFFAETAKIKIPSVCSYILQTLESKQKFLVFAHHRKMLDAIEKVLLKMRKHYIRIDGNTTSDQRKYYVDKFQLDDTYECAVLSITAANAGITLTAAQLVLFAELHWNPSILSQAESRAHRIGQEGKVSVKYLLASGTADDSIWPLLQNKQKILQEVGIFKDSFENVSVTKQDSNKLEPIAACLNTSQFMDITSYFQKIETHSDNCDQNKAQASSSTEVDFFDDDLDDILEQVEIDL